MSRLKGKVAVITGATSGIGEASARRFVKEGASVVLAARNESRGEAIADDLGRSAVFVRTDVTQESDIAAAVDAAVSEFGSLDCLFSNAAALPPGTVFDVTPDEIEAAMRLLIGSVLLGIKHAARVMAGRGGSVINNSSVAALRTGQGPYLYSTAKAAVTHATRLAAVELGPLGIRVNSISPGAIATPVFWGGYWGGSAVADGLTPEEHERKQRKLEGALEQFTPLGRSGVGDDIAEAAVFLASDAGSFVNGHDLVVDGGRIWAYNEKPGSMDIKVS